MDSEWAEGVCRVMRPAPRKAYFSHGRQESAHEKDFESQRERQRERYNATVGRSVTSLPETLGMLLTSLTALDMWCCPGLLTLPQSLGQLKSLQQLALSRSPIQAIPDSIGDLKQLCGARVSTESCTLSRMTLTFTPLRRLKCCHACGLMAFLVGWTSLLSVGAVNSTQTLKGTAHFQGVRPVDIIVRCSFLNRCFLLGLFCIRGCC
jgi:hypothetical protein